MSQFPRQISTVEVDMADPGDIDSFASNTNANTGPRVALMADIGNEDHFHDDPADIPEMNFDYDYDDDELDEQALVGHAGDEYGPDPAAPLNTASQSPQSPSQSSVQKASIVSCTINLLNTVAGAGMLGLPGAYAGSGYFVGTLLLVTAAFFSSLGLHLLAKSAATARSLHLNAAAATGGNSRGASSTTSTTISSAKPASFYSVATAAMPEFAIFIDAAVALKCFGVATGYFVTVGDCMVDSFHYFFRNFNSRSETQAEEMEEMVFTNRHFWVICALILVLPISFFKTLNSLKFTSTLSLMLIYALLAGIVLYAEGVFDPCVDDSNGDHHYYRAEDDLVHTDDTCKGEIDIVTNFDSTMKNLAIFVFSFTCHQNVFSIVNELERPTQRRVDSVIGLAIGSALILYLVVAIEGYRTFGSNVKGDILLNYPQDGLVTTMRIGIAIMVILSYPLQLDPSRRCLTSLIYALIGKREQRRQREQMRLRARAGLPPIDANDDQDEAIMDEATEETVRLAQRSSQSPNPSLSNMDPVDSGSSSSNIPVDPVAEIAGDDEYLQQFLESVIFYGITCAFLVLSFMIAMIVSDLGIILGVVGATGSTMVSYILPGAIYLKLHPERHFLRTLAHIQLIIGILIVPTALYFIIFKGGVG